MNKVVYNARYGGFSLSRAAVARMAELGSEWAKKALLDHEQYLQHWEKKTPGTRDSRAFYDSIHLNSGEITRHDPLLVRIVEEMGDGASGGCAALKIATVAGNEYRIDEYDGHESVQEPSDVEWTKIKP